VCWVHDHRARRPVAAATSNQIKNRRHVPPHVRVPTEIPHTVYYFTRTSGGAVQIYPVITARTVESWFTLLAQCPRDLVWEKGAAGHRRQLGCFKLKVEVNFYQASDRWLKAEKNPWLFDLRVSPNTRAIERSEHAWRNGLFFCFVFCVREQVTWRLLRAKLLPNSEHSDGGRSKNENVSPWPSPDKRVGLFAFGLSPGSR
jgi:hypothetical protein